MKRALALFGIIGYLASTCTAIIAGIQTFTNPASQFHQKYDGIWFLLFLTSLAFSGFLIAMRRERFLLILAIILALAGIIFPLFFIDDALSSVLITLWILTTSLGIGTWLIKKIARNTLIHTAVQGVIAITLGMGSLMMIMFVLGTLNAFNPILVFILFLFLTLLSLPNIINTYLPASITSLKVGWNTGDLRLPALVVTICIICCFGSYLWALAPAVRYDALSYHIAAPTIYIQNSSIVQIPENVQTYWSHNGEMLYTLSLLLGGKSSPALLHLTAALLTGILVFFLGKDIFNRHVGWFGSIFFITLPIISFEAGSAYVEMFVALFIIGCLSLLTTWWRTKQSSVLLLAGITAGFALGTKLTALPIIFVVFFFLVVNFLVSKETVFASFKRISVFILPAILLFLPWLIRDWLWTGNPVFPNFNQLFNSPAWFSTGLFEVQGLTRSSQSTLLLFPWSMVVNSRFFYHEAPGGAIAGLSLLFLPWLYLSPDLLPRHNRRTAGFLLIFCLACILLFFAVSVNLRYLIPVFPIMSLLAGLNLSVAQDFISPLASRWSRIFLGLGLILLLGYTFSTRVSLTMRYWEVPERFPVKLAIGRSSSEEFINQVIPEVSAFRYLDGYGDGIHKVFAVGCEYRLYTNSRVFGVLYSYEARQIKNEAKNAEDLALRLAKKDYEVILVNNTLRRAFPALYDVPTLTNDFLKQFAKLEYAHRGILVYRFIPEGVAPATSHNLLVNSSFEIVLNNQPSGWLHHGPLMIDSSGYKSFTGVTAVKVHSPIPTDKYSFIFQQVNINPQEVYTAGYWAKTASGAVTLQLQINWLDKDENQLYSELDWLDLRDEWQFYQLHATAPWNAAYAQVVASVTGDGTAWIDDLCFASGGHCEQESTDTP